MKFSKIQEDIIHYIIDYDNKPEQKLTPCIETLQQIFHNKYSNLEIETSVLELISSGVLKTYSFHSYLIFSETFITSLDYKLFKNKKF